MSASYPSAAKSFTSRVAGDTIQPAHINDLQDEVAAIETDLRANGGAPTGQIKFPAAQNASTDVNTLDDYEEGTWTPVIASSGGGTATYTTQTGQYVKVGKKVTLTGRITLSSKAGLSAGTITITGLPFTAATLASHVTAAPVPYWANLTTAAVHLAGFVASAGVVISLNIAAAATATLSAMTVADLANTSDLIFTVTYLASA